MHCDNLFAQDLKRERKWLISASARSLHWASKDKTSSPQAQQRYPLAILRRRLTLPCHQKAPCSLVDDDFACNEVLFLGISTQFLSPSAAKPIFRQRQSWAQYTDPYKDSVDWAKTKISRDAPCIGRQSCAANISIFVPYLERERKRLPRMSGSNIFKIQRAPEDTMLSQHAEK